jgi:hypothetical protein
MQPIAVVSVLVPVPFLDLGPIYQQQPHCVPVPDARNASSLTVTCDREAPPQCEDPPQP